MRQQHQIISRNNHDEHGTIGEHINTQWGLILFRVTFEFSCPKILSPENPFEFILKLNRDIKIKTFPSGPFNV